MLNNKVILFVVNLFVLSLTACFDETYNNQAKQRAKLAEKSQAPIVIGIAWEDDDDSFILGAKLAVKQINNDGGILNRPLELIINSSESKLKDSSLSQKQYQDIVINIATAFANKPEVIAVIGHRSSKASLLASVVYQNVGVLYLSPTATNIKLTNHQFNYVFRTTLNNYKMGTQIADYIAEKGYKKIALLNDRDIYATELSDTFSVYVTEKHGAKIVFSRSFFKNTVDLTSLVIELKKADEFDIVFVASNNDFVKNIYTQSRDMGTRVPFVGGETLDTPSFLKEVEEWENAPESKKSMIPAMFNHLLPENQPFIELFQKEYGEEYQPDQLAAVGYDNITLLAHAIKRTQSTIPARIADTLRYMQPCQGLAGKYEFNEEGDLLDKPFYFKELQQKQYQYSQLEDADKLFSKSIEICNKIDRDNDSIPNNLDACVDNTPDEIAKGIILTGLKRGCPIDNDKDHVPDYSDKCPENNKEEIAKGVDKLGCPIDTDGDKTADYEDACPNNPELTDFVSGKNCVEDRDGDEITDDIDQCPDNSKEEISKGVIKEGNQKGCPVDTDFDKLADYLDSCPENTTAEMSQGVDNKGCPADNDADGILDYQDNCLQTPANAQIDKQGCGIIENSIMLQTSALYFKQGKITLTTQGKSHLEALIGQIKTDMLKQIKIAVHTDNKGDSEKNQTLSEEQAATIEDYLVERDIDCEKIIAEGKGNSIPVADNKTFQGRKQNHRLEIILRQFKNKPLPVVEQENSSVLETQ